MIKNTADKVSVIMPSYNSRSTIEASILSVLAQTYVDWELIIVDDRSTDNTWQVIQTYADKYDNIRTKVFSCPCLKNFSISQTYS